MRSILTALQEGRLFELPDAGKDRALEFLARILDANPDIVVGTDTIEEVQKREQECNTGIGLGVGVPHIRAQREEGELFAAIGWSPAGIEYGAQDNEKVHLVVMYYIPGAQKNVYLKEISSLIKAIRKSGGIQPIAHATDLNQVRNLLLDWVSSGLGDAGPEAVARMIKLDVKQTQAAAPVPAIPAPTLPEAVAVRPGARVTPFQVLVTAPGSHLILAPDSICLGQLEKDAALVAQLAAGAAFLSDGQQIIVLGVTPYAGGRTLYQCALLATPAG